MHKSPQSQIMQSYLFFCKLKISQSVIHSRQKLLSLEVRRQKNTQMPFTAWVTNTDLERAKKTKELIAKFRILPGNHYTWQWMCMSRKKVTPRCRWGCAWERLLFGRQLSRPSAKIFKSPVECFAVANAFFKSPVESANFQFERVRAMCSLCDPERLHRQAKLRRYICGKSITEQSPTLSPTKTIPTWPTALKKIPGPH